MPLRRPDPCPHPGLDRRPPHGPSRRVAGACAAAPWPRRWRVLLAVAAGAATGVTAAAAPPSTAPGQTAAAPAAPGASAKPTPAPTRIDATTALSPTPSPLPSPSRGQAAVRSPSAPAPARAEAPDDAATAVVDPVERLRRRLAERLAGGRDAGGKLEVRLPPPGAPAPSATAPAGPPGDGGTGRRRHAVPAAAPPAVAGVGGPVSGGRWSVPADAAAAHRGPAWAYDGAGGPAAWGALTPGFERCARGRRQSPIDLRGGLAVDLDPVEFDYRLAGFSVVDNGRTVQADLTPGSGIDLGGRRFELLQLHFHRPSEERVDGRAFEMSLHLVHRDEQGRLAVVALLIERGAPSPLLQQVWRNLPLERDEARPARHVLDLQGLLPADRRYYTYMGSLTTPPCSEGVQWVVLRQPVTASAEQIELFARLYPMNARPLQPAAGRRILQSR